MDKIHKIDRLREYCREIVSNCRDALAENGGATFINDHISEERIRKLCPWEICKLTMAYMGQLGKLKDEDAVNLMAAASIVEEAHPFIFEDKQLTKDILGAEIRRIPPEALKFPMKRMLIELPESIDFPDGSGDKWDIAYIYADLADVYPTDRPMNSPAEVAKYMFKKDGVKQEETWLIVCTDSTKDFKNTYFWVYPDRLSVIEEGMRISGHGKEELVGPALLQIARLVFFINSPSAIVNTVRRGKPPYKAPDVVRRRFPSTRMVSISKERTNYEYDEDYAPESGRYSVRFAVRGHFKYYTKGVLRGRVLYCPPFWKGPDVGEQVDRKYVIA
jgi:hypothetical protein